MEINTPATQSEIVNVIEEAGLTPDGADLTQLAQAINKIAEDKAVRCLSPDRMLIVQDQKPQGVSGGASTAGVWITRDLNAVVRNTISGASLSSNVVTLPAGDYYIEASAPGYFINGHQARLYDTTADAVLCNGLPALANDSYAIPLRSCVNGFFTLEEESELILQQYCMKTFTYGHGQACNIDTEIYSEARIWQL
ncbi:hypothetical protein [Desulfocurvus sp. DL9XJH121]